MIAGERRWEASRSLGYATIPAIVRQVSNEQAMEMTIVENLQREDLNAMEQARAYERLGREFGLTQEQMAQRTGKERSSVANFMRLLKLPVAVQAMVEKNQISFGHAKALMAWIARGDQRWPVASPSSAIRRQTEEAVTTGSTPSQRRKADANRRS